MKTLIATLATAALITTPLAASASHGDGGHAAGGFSGGHGFGGFRGGGGQTFGGGARGLEGHHGGGGRGFGDHRGEHFHGDHFRDDGGDAFLFEAGFGFGLGFYDDPWAYGYFPTYYPYDDAGYDPAALPSPVPTRPAGANAATPAETAQCGAWHWQADLQRYRWAPEAC
ncbi:MAG TPA: hypothetical protein VKQ54_04410 [Caulobacteraceae bacterium]|nr:hypothetical protein [Caulobacteraceae bacterium]